MFQKDMRELSRAVDTPSIFEAPEGLNYFPFQAAGIDFCLSNPNHNSLIGDEPGLGKTIQAVGYSSATGASNMLIVAPASLLFNWAKEVRRWHLNRDITIQVITTSKMDLDPTRDVHVVSYSLATNKKIHRFLQRKCPDVLVLDEVHYLKNPKAKRTKAIYKDSGNLADVSSNIIALSGTPILNRPKEIYETISKLCPDAIDGMSYDAYARRYCGAWWDKRFNKLWDGGSSNERELGDKLRSSFMVRRKKIDVLKDLPSKIINLAILDPSRKAKSILRSMSAFSPEEIIRLKGVTTHYEGLSTMRRELGAEKVVASVNYVKNVLDSGRDKIVLFAHHKEVLLKLKEDLAAYEPVIVYGATSKTERQKAVDKFQTDRDTRVFIGGIVPCGEGITLTAASYVAFIEFSWVPGSNAQAEDRCHRIGQKDSVLIEYLVYPDSLDHNILKSSTRKSLSISDIMS